MDQLIELRDWQLLQEEMLRQKQTKQMDSLSHQNVKPISLTNDLLEDNQMKTITNNLESMPEMVTSPQSNTNLDNCFYDGVKVSNTEEEVCHQNNSYSESCPVVPGINGKEIKTFEEFLNLKLNNNKSDFTSNNENKPKKPFLRKGSGIKRFQQNKTQINSSTKVETNTKKRQTNERLLDKKIPKVVTKPYFSVKDFVDKKKVKKIQNEENNTKLKPFNRKVIPMTTKFEKFDNKSVQISRDTPTLNLKSLNETDFELFNYLKQMYENISISENSIEDKDINELQDLLKKIEIKKEMIEGFDLNSSENELNFCDDSEDMKIKNNLNVKKRVHFNDIHSNSSSDEEKDKILDLEQPKSGAYSSKLKQQILELEDQLSRLKNIKKDKSIDNCVPKTIENSELISDELKKLRQRIDKMNDRIVNIESKAYDKRSKEKSLPKSCCIEQNRGSIPKMFSSTAPNILVNDISKETVIDFPNGDKMMVSKDNTIIYNFVNGTTQTTYPDGFKITHFPNGQTEKVDRNGVKRISYPSGLQRTINPDSSEEVLMTDGTLWRIHSDGSEVLEFPNGDREIRTNKYKRREYRNGNIKTLYSDGTEETRYISGRLRIKDKFGNLMVDSMAKHLDQHFSQKTLNF